MVSDSQKLVTIKKKYHSSNPKSLDQIMIDTEQLVSKLKEADMTKILSKLKLVQQKRERHRGSKIERMRRKLIERIGEQMEIITADLAGKEYQGSKRIYEKDENGIKVEKLVPRIVRRWFWQNKNDVWFLELRYGNRPLNLHKLGRNAIEVGKKDQLLSVLEDLKVAVAQGELDEHLLAL